MSVKVLDIEANNLLANMLDFSCLPYKLKSTAKLWCIVVYDLSSKTYTRLSSESGDGICREDVAKALDGCTELVTYNGIKFDLLTLKLFGLLDYTIGYLNEPDTLYGKEVKITDDLVRSRLFNPDRRGGHSLKSWGERLGEYKDDFRAKCVESGHILRDSVKGSEFRNYTPLMVDYCQQDTLVTAMVHSELEKEYNSYKGWTKSEKIENKLADVAIRRESYGFYFDKDLAVECLTDLQEKMDELQNRVNPILPPKMMNKTSIKQFTPPKNQLKQDNTPTAHMLDFAKKHGATITDTLFEYKGKCYSIPFTDPIERYEKADISDLDHVKKHLIDLGWNPTEFKIRDLTKDSKKQSIIYEKRVKALDTWLDQTFDDGKYKKHRLLELGLGTNKVAVRQKLIKKLSGDRPVRVPTSPCVRVGVEKDLCPNLTSLGEKVSFANDFTLYLTYKHRKSSIAGGDLEDVDFDDEYPNTGFLSMYREVDKRIPTPAIEIGASCVPANTRLLTWDGYKKIVDVKVGDKVLTHEGTYQVVTDCIDNGVKPTFKVTLSNGMTLTCTANHPFYTTNGWVRCEDLDTNDVYVYGEKEVWKGAVGFDGYKVSSWGSVIGKRGFNVKHLTSNISGRPCSADLYTTPYNKTRKSVGRLVCEAFNGGDKNLEVRHLDGNSWNNNAENLVFGTSAENSADWKLHGSCGLVANAVRKLQDSDVSEIKHLVSFDGKRGAHGRVAKIFNVSREHVRDICSGKIRAEVLDTTTKFVQSFKTAKVMGVEYVCDQPTFDITVADAHSYVAEGIVVHNTNRYRHIGVCNVARASSIYGEQMRSLFGCGDGMRQLGFDFSSLEARIQGHYILAFNGEELAQQLLASKPNDIHCYSEDTEILTDSGWKSFGELLEDDKVAQYDNGLISFVKPLDIVWQKYDGYMYTDPTTQFKVTPNHRVLVKGFTSGKHSIVRADEFKPSSDKRYIVGGNKVGSNLELSDSFVKLLVATQADGYLSKDCSEIVFTFVKERKVERLEMILQSLGVSYGKSSLHRKGREEITIRVPSGCLALKVRDYLDTDKSFKNGLINLPYEQLVTFVNEVKHWDGYVCKNGDIVLDTTDKKSCEFLQTVASLVGYKTNYNCYEKSTHFGECTIHRVYISTKTLAVKSANKPLTVSQYSGFIGCVSVPSGLVLVKRNNSIVVSGNTVNAKKLGIPRDQAKSVSYMLMYGGSAKRAQTMLGCTLEEAEIIVEAYWDAVLPLKLLREAMVKKWEERDKKYIIGVDGRKIFTRSQHSLLNSAFQSGGVICAKYATVFIYQLLEAQGFKCDPFAYSDLDACGMIEYHDELQLAVHPKHIPLKVFNTEDEALEFKKSWVGEQLGELTHLKNGKPCFALPNPVSKAISEAISLAEKEVNLKVPLGMEWIVHKNWFGCH